MNNALPPHDEGSCAPRGYRRPLCAMRAGFFFIALAGLILFVRVFDLQSALSPAWADSHLHFSPGSGMCRSVLLYVSLVAVLSPLGVPRQALSALGGYAFGAAYGILFASAGLVLGCAAGFFFSRLLARSVVQRRLAKRIERLDAFLSRSPFLMTVAIRFFPVGNNALLNLLAGVTAIPARAFIAGSAIGYLPQTIIFALLGSGIRVDPLWRTCVSAALFVLATGFGFWLYRRYDGEQADIGVPAQSGPAEDAACANPKKNRT